MQRLYDLNGIILAVVADERDVGFLDPILACLDVQTRILPDWTVRIDVVDRIEVPAASDLIWQGPLPEGLESVLSERDGRRSLTVVGQCTLTHQKGSHSTLIEVIAPGTDAIRGTAAFWLIDEVLVERGQFLLHGACLVRPETREAIAIFAPSGTGKTTTALALARNGLALATDDALVLENTGDDSLIWGIPRATKVDRRTADFLPWLQPVLKDWQAEEQALSLAEVGKVVRRAPPGRYRCAAVVVLTKPNAIDHRIDNIAKADALTLILSDNVRRAPAGVDANGQATFAAAALLVAGTPSFILSVGPDPNSLSPDLIFAMIRSHVAD
jgi:hypothetical protein